MTSDKLEAAADHYRAMCDALGVDLTRADTQDTPKRYVKMLYHDFMSGLREPDFSFTTFPSEGSNQLVTIPGIRMVSMCAHHHLPFMGLCHVCYLPNATLVGLSKLPRAIQWIAKQPTMQEHIVTKIVEYLAKELQPRFIGLSMIAEHTCMSCRGVNEHGSLTVTNKFWSDPNEKGKDGESLDVGDFETTKQEFLNAIKMWHYTKGLAR